MRRTRRSAAATLGCLLLVLAATSSPATLALPQEESLSRIETLWEQALPLIRSEDPDTAERGIAIYSRLVDEIRAYREKSSQRWSRIPKRLAKIEAAMQENKETIRLRLIEHHVGETEKVLRKMELALVANRFEKVDTLYHEKLLPMLEKFGCETGNLESELRDKGNRILKDAQVGLARLSNSWILTSALSEPVYRAELSIESPKDGETLTDRRVSVTLALEGFELGVETKGAAERGIANSPQGQHVKIIVDDGPSMACHDVSKPFPIGELEPGTHVVRAFLCRSCHESVKTMSTVAKVVFHVGKASAPPLEVHLPLVTLSSPEGDYVGDDANRILLDFFVMSARTDPWHWVRLTVDDIQERVSKRGPYSLEGLGDGQHTVRLELMHEEEPVPGPFTRAERTITVRSSP